VGTEKGELISEDTVETTLMKLGDWFSFYVGDEVKGGMMLITT
jgi:hypothetical protein